MVKYKFNSKTDKVFFTADTHFYHKNVIRYCKRPFSSVEEMNEELINNWNKVVGPDDYIFHLGDFCFVGSDKFKSIIKRLNGHIILIRGNHDHVISKSMEKSFEYVTYQMTIEIDKIKIYLNHYPFLTYAGPYKNPPSYQLFGHVHNNKIGRLSLLHPTQYNVGVDTNDYTPISWEILKTKLPCKMTLKQKLMNWIVQKIL